MPADICRVSLSSYGLELPHNHRDLLSYIINYSHLGSIIDKHIIFSVER